jgi:transcriptional regulator with XRE-family HTH domain
MEPTEADIVVRIDKALNAKRASRKELYLSLDLASNTFSNWETRGTIPAADIAIRIADYLGVSVRWLITGEDEQGLTLEERNLVNDWNRLTAENQRNLRALMASMLAVMDSQKDVLDKAE